jgi:4-hydroxybenzoate polyprenyltransferase
MTWREDLRHPPRPIAFHQLTGWQVVGLLVTGAAISLTLVFGLPAAIGLLIGMAHG